jgi:O-antigen/teichoic acid export membrane protein
MTDGRSCGHWSFFCPVKRVGRHSPDLLVLAALLLLPLLIFWPVTLGSRTLIPADNLFQWAPWRTYAEAYDAAVPHNELLSDLLLENYAWKRFLLDSIRERQIPLWNPHLFAGVPFLAAGQHSALYPFSLLFYVLPLERAYGVFTISQLFLAGAFMYLFGRVLGMRRGGAALAAVVYQLCSYMLVSVDFPMILAASAWLPLLLAMIELVVRQRPVLGGQPATLPWVVLGAAGLGLQLLAGHGENSYFTLLVMGLYAVWRLGTDFVAGMMAQGDEGRSLIAHARRTLMRPAAWLLIMVILGIGLGTVQVIPFFEVVQHNFREGAASLADVLSWAYPWRRIITLVAPNFFGNPSHHAYWDLFSWQKEPATANAYGDSIFKIDWGIKNYVEGGAYLGLLPLLLAAIALLSCLRPRSKPVRGQASIWFFALLALASLTFIFPTGTYAIIHALPIINQSHSPFRWVFPLALSVAVLAGWGMGVISNSERGGKRDGAAAHRYITALALGGGTIGIAGLLISRAFYGRLEPWVERLFLGLAKAPEAFPDASAFFSYEFLQLVIAALVMLAAGLVLLLAWRRPAGRLWVLLAVALVAVDLAVATWNFNPAADPALLKVKPELIRFLESRPGLWRLTTFDPHGDQPLHANTPWLFDLQDVRGYDSIIPKQYANYMAAIEPQGELLYNRIQPIKRWESLNSPLLDLLNVKYIITAETLELPKLVQVWAGEGVQVYENLAVAPRAFTLPAAATVVADDPLAMMGQLDPRNYVVLALSEVDPSQAGGEPMPASLSPAAVARYGSQEVTIDARVAEPSWLVLTDSYFPGWKAFTRELGADEGDEVEVEVIRVDGNFRGVRLEPGEWTVRFKYSPMSFKLGLFISFLAAVVIVFLGGVWLWRYAYRESPDDSTVRRVAKNSLAPMALNLFNKGIDFAFAALMLRILGAENAGKYYVAISIASWFEILANFGLNTLLMREVSKERGAANRYLVNTTVLRLITGLGGVVPIAIYVLSLAAGPRPLAQDTTLAILLFILGMVPGGVNTGLTALFYAYEKAEIPAALTTVSTLIRVSLSVIVLLMGAGFVGLAGVSIIVNLVTMVLLGWLAFREFFVPRWEFDWGLQKGMVRESFPLMINHLLATLFFKVDVLLLERLGGKVLMATGNTVVGWYSTAYKWLDAINIIPSFFTMAIFPVMSRQADESPQEMKGTYQLAIKLLTIVALPLAIVTICVAPLLVQILGGSEYLPHGAVALQLMIWSIPIGWINSITNYVLIALGRQRMLTRAFIVGLGFNLIANAIFLPRYDYRATAVIAILSELVLLAAFYYTLRPAMGSIPWLEMLWRPLVAAGLMGLVTWAGYQVHWVLGVAAGVVAYGVGLVWLRVLTPAERSVLASILPPRLKRG